MSPSRRRTQHWTDYSGSGNTITRKIRNHQNYQLPSGLWAPSNPNAQEGSAPSDWEGNYDFLLQSLEAPLQTFVVDTTDSGNTTLCGMRLSRHPGAWLNWKAVGVNQNAPYAILSPVRIRWQNLWNNTDLIYQLLPHSLRRVIVLKQPNHPVNFHFALKTSPALTTQDTANGLKFFGPQGQEVFHVKPPVAEDANENPAVCAFAQSGTTPGGLPIYRTSVDAEWLSDATYPVRIT